MEMKDRFAMLGNKLIWHPEILARWKNNGFFYPLHMDIGATSSCNFRCVHCFYDYQKHKPNFLKREKLLSLVKELGTLGVKSIFFASNGEPLLNEALPDAIIEAKKSGLDIAISTNASLLNNKISQKILPHLCWMRISVLAASKETYCRLHRVEENIWENVFKNIRDAVVINKNGGYNVTIGAQMCLLNENGDEIIPLVKKLKDIGVDYITIRPISQTIHNVYHTQENLVKKYSSILKEAEKLSDDKFAVYVRWNLVRERKYYTKCLGLPFIAFVAADGGVYTCGCHLEDKNYCYGNINEKSFQEIWKSNFRKDLMNRAINAPDFDTCDIFCRHHSINEFLWDYSHPPKHLNFI